MKGVSRLSVARHHTLPVVCSLPPNRSADGKQRSLSKNGHLPHGRSNTHLSGMTADNPYEGLSQSCEVDRINMIPPLYRALERCSDFIM